MRYAVVGDPVEHSRSPAIHNAAFKACGVDAEFGFMHVPVDGFDQVTLALRSGRLDGVSVTMPHKRNAFEVADQRSDFAVRSSAVNTLIVRDDLLVGMNTDVAGVQYALSAAGADDDGPILLLGCGGAAAAALLAVEGRSIHLSCRDAARSALLLRRIAVDAAVIPWGTPLQSATVINTTPLGMSGETLPDGVVERAGALLDMAYGFERTPAIAHALALGIPAADGLSMLVGQAAAAFELFTGEEAPIYVMEQAARA